LPPGSSSLHSPLHRRRQVSLLNDADDSRRLGSALTEAVFAASPKTSGRADVPERTSGS
jgi:hypothetical protein